MITHKPRIKGYVRKKWIHGQAQDDAKRNNNRARKRVVRQDVIKADRWTGPKGYHNGTVN